MKDIVAPMGRVKMGGTEEFSEQEFNERYWDRYSTVSQGYNAIEGARFPDERTRARRSSLEQYEIHIRQYRTDSATLMKIIAPMLARPSGNTPDPHVWFSEFGRHPLAYLRGLLDRFLVAKGATVDCSAPATDLDRLVFDLRVMFPPP